MLQSAFRNPAFKPQGLIAQSALPMRFFSPAAAKKASVATASKDFIPTMPLQYMVHMARVKVNLPQQGDCWFFIDPRDKVADFINTVKEEDSMISKLELLSGTGVKPTQLKANDVLYEVLQDRSKPMYLRLNGMMYEFETQRAGNNTVDLAEKSTWFSQCEKLGLNNAHSSTLSTIIGQLETNLAFPTATAAPAQAEATTEEKKPKKKTTKKAAAAQSGAELSVSAVCDEFVNQSKFFENAVVREQIFQLRALQLISQIEFKQLDAQKTAIENKEKSRHLMRVYGLTAFFTAQFTVGYYAIFCVPWLGWDLVEPITYTVGQGSFILGLLLIMRNRGANIEYSDLEELYCRQKRKLWLEKYNFDLKKHAFLQRKLDRIQDQLDAAELQRFK